jgi:hypothetical protein
MTSASVPPLSGPCSCSFAFPAFSSLLLATSPSGTPPPSALRFSCRLACDSIRHGFRSLSAWPPCQPCCAPRNLLPIGSSHSGHYIIDRDVAKKREEKAEKAKEQEQGQDNGGTEAEVTKGRGDHNGV